MDNVMLIWRQDNKEPADKIIPLLTLLDEEAESKPEEKKDTGQLHSLEDHNYCISRSGHCPYCADGSKPVPGCLITGASD